MPYLLAVISFLVGYHLRDIKEKLVYLAAKLLEIKDKQKKAELPQTTFAEPMSKTELVAKLEEEKIRLLNS